MRLRPVLYALVALFVAHPFVASAAVVVSATVGAPAGPVSAGSAVPVTCRADGSSSSMGATTIDRIDVAVTGGAVAPAALTGATTGPCAFDPTRTCSILEGAVTWTTPAEAGALTVTCTATHTTSSFVGSQVGTTAGSAQLTTEVPAVPAPVVAGFTGPSELMAGSGAQVYAVQAYDPSTPPAPLAYAWSASCGALVQDPANPHTAAFTPPATGGSCTLGVVVSNGVTLSSTAKVVSVTLATYQARLPASLSTPRRLAVGRQGEIYVVDAYSGRLHMLSALGFPRASFGITSGATAVARAPDVLYVATRGGRLVRLDPASGLNLGEVPLQDGRFVNPAGMAWDGSRGNLWVADHEAGAIRVVARDGATVKVLTEAGGASLRGVVDVAVDAAGGRAYALLNAAKFASDLVAGDPPEQARLVHAFDLDGTYLTSLVPAGSGAGEVTRAAGITVDGSGRFYVSDAYQSTIQAFDRSGASQGAIGAWGQAPGQLQNPTGVAILANGDVAVANTSLGRLDRFGTGVPLTQPCLVDGKLDTDCDGLDDAWEKAHGLDPLDPSDAAADADADGLGNLDEYRLGTDPRLADSDRDGVSDRDEVLAGFDPLDPGDHVATLVAGAPAASDPGLVRVIGTASGAGTCAVTWAQRSGPAVTLRDGASASPSFVARAAGRYVLEGTARCGRTAATRVSSEAVTVSVAVANVAPVAVAGRVAVLHVGDRADLTAAASSDANGDALSFDWEQVAGSPAVATGRGARLVIRPLAPGYQAFQLQASDPAGLKGEDEVQVVALASGVTVPTVTVAGAPLTGQVGSPVALGAASEDGTGFAWEQLSGAPVAGLDASAAPVVVPQAAGRHLFRVSALAGEVRSPPALVELLVAEAGGALPVAAASAPSTAVVGAPVALEGGRSTAASGGALAYAWRQVDGPAAGLTQADQPSATVVPFTPGFYAFELVVTEGAVRSAAARVAFAAQASGAALPVAAAAGPASAAVGEKVRLDGRASEGARRYRWTQVAGPWVALQATQAAPVFVPLAPGQYAFELEVDDGVARSRPQRVSVLVIPVAGEVE